MLRALRASAAVAVALVASGCTETDCDEFAFDGERWVNGDGTAKYELAQGLVDCDWLIGKTRREIRDGLGRPESGRKSREWEYFVDANGDSDADAMMIEFDSAGRVTHASIRVH